MRPTIEFRLLQCVVTLAEELSFTQAAKKLYIAQPALSRQITQLERSLGVKLFNRSTRQVTLTPAGMAFVEEARAALAHNERAWRLARAVSRGEDSPVSVGYSPHYNFDLLGSIMKRAERRFGATGIVFTSSFTRHQIQNVLDGTWDAGLCFFPVEDAALETIVLLEERVCVVVPKNHRVATRPEETVSYHELENDAVVRFARKIHPGFARELEKVWTASGYKPRATHDVNTVAEAVALVAAGTGIAFFKSSLRNVLPPTVRMLDLPDKETLTIRMGILCRKHGRSSGAEKFLNLLSGLMPRGKSARPLSART